MLWQYCMSITHNFVDTLEMCVWVCTRCWSLHMIIQCFHEPRIRCYKIAPAIDIRHSIPESTYRQCVSVCLYACMNSLPLEHPYVSCNTNRPHQECYCCSNISCLLIDYLNSIGINFTMYINHLSNNNPCVYSLNVILC